MKITFNANNFDPDTRWINPGHVLAGVFLLTLLALFVYALVAA